jgi:uncharacterized protein
LKRAVFDTNVWISGLVFGGEVRNVIRAAVEGKILPVTSTVLLQELEKVLGGRKLRFPPEAVSTILYEVQTLAVMTHPRQRINAIGSDPADNRVLECGLSGKAHWIVSGDSDLLDLGNFRGMEILSPRDFLKAIE